MKRALRTLLFFCLFGVIAGPVTGASANDLPEQTGETVLTVSVAGTGTETEKPARFDLHMLESLGEDEFTTSTIWTEGKIRFTGVRLKRLLEVLGVSDGKLELVALNDYLIEIPVNEALESPALIAYAMNGEPMSPRGKGPLWLVYPYDSALEYQSETYYSRSIWQVDQILVYQ